MELSCTDRKSKKWLYQIVQLFLDDKLDATSFCYEFYLCYEIELDDPSLLPEEDRLFDEMGRAIDRFPALPEDAQGNPNHYGTILELRQAIGSLQKKLLETSAASNFSGA